MREHTLAEVLRLLFGPGPETFAAFDAELALGDELVEIGIGTRRPVEVRDHRAVNVERQLRADQVRVFERPEHGETTSETGLDDGVHRARIADALRDERDRLAPKRMLQAV